MMTKRDDTPVLPKVLQETYDLLSIKPNSAFVIEKTGRDRRTVNRDINRLIAKGKIRKTQIKGLWEVIKLSSSSGQVVPLNKEKQDFFRYHNLEIKARLKYSDVKKLRNILIKNEHYGAIEKPNGIYVKYLVTGLVTEDSLYLTFPEGWEVSTLTMEELMNKVYAEVMLTLHKWSYKFRLGLFAEGRVNFEIVNQHLAISNNGLVKEFKSNKVDQFIVYDNNDGKARFLFDFSKGLAELEAVHPTKALIDGQEAKFLMETLKEGRYRRMYENQASFFDSKVDMTYSQIFKMMQDIVELQKVTVNNINEVNKGLNQLNYKVEEYNNR